MMLVTRMTVVGDLLLLRWLAAILEVYLYEMMPSCTAIAEMIEVGIFRRQQYTSLFGLPLMSRF